MTGGLVFVVSNSACQCYPSPGYHNLPLKTPKTLFLSFELLPVPLLFRPMVIGSFGRSLSLGSTTPIGWPIPMPTFSSKSRSKPAAAAYGLPGAEKGW
jgi:hypothetical protein